MRHSFSIFPTSLLLFIFPLLLWAQPPIEPVIIKPEPIIHPSPPGKKKKEEKKNLIIKDKHSEIWKISLETRKCLKGECLLVKKQEMREFEVFEGNIESFIYTKGNTYTLQVGILTFIKTSGLELTKYKLEDVIATSDPRYNKL
ncbi:MAG: DUF4377 domain-containing protein [Chitinophagales bacterium]